MIWRRLCPVPLFLLLILAVGCNSSAKQVQMEEFIKDAELMAALQAPSEQPLGLERPIIPTQHPPITIHPETHIKVRIPIVTLNSNPRSKILMVTPDPNIDYKISVATTEPGIDYKMLVVPDQKHMLRTLEEPQFPLRQKPEVAPVPRKPKDQGRDDAK